MAVNCGAPAFRRRFRTSATRKPNSHCDRLHPRTQGANSQVWQSVVPSFTNQQGQVVYHTNSYTELCTGLNHLNSANHQWMPSSEDIQITAGGGAAINGQHQVYFSANINASNAVEIVTPDGVDLRSHILGIAYFDTTTGKNVLFAELQDSTGQLVASNQVVYPDAFTDCKASVRYTYTRAGSEQDIVVEQQLPAPATYGLNPDTTWLQVWTEFTDPPSPVIEPILDGADVRLDFGMYKMERGKAFIMGNELNSVPVNKSWRTVQGRTFLVEQVQFDAVASQLQSLPATSGGNGTNGTGIQQIHYRGFPKQLPPPPKLVKRADERLKLASTRAPEKGLGTGLRAVRRLHQSHVPRRHHLLHHRERQPLQQHRHRRRNCGEIYELRALHND